MKREYINPSINLSVFDTDIVTEASGVVAPVSGEEAAAANITGTNVTMTIGGEGAKLVF